jgi:hypothetical protein
LNRASLQQKNSACLLPMEVRRANAAVAWRFALGSEAGRRTMQRDLVAIWEEHCRCEFETRDTNATMATMVARPYVNHMPTMTGGVGYAQLQRFYANHFIPVNPPTFA